MNLRWYEYLHKLSYHVVDFTGKNDTILQKTQAKVAELPIRRKRKADVINESAVQIFNETIPPKKLTLYILTLYHATNITYSRQSKIRKGKQSFLHLK